MSKPPSIVTFERLYLASFALWLIGTIAFWNVTAAAIRDMPSMAGNPVAPIIGPILIGSAVVTALVTLLLWYLVARQASVVGKWMVVVTEAIGAVMGVLLLMKLLRGTVSNLPMSLLGLVVTALAVAAAALLFRPDAKAWFGEVPGEPLA